MTLRPEAAPGPAPAFSNPAVKVIDMKLHFAPGACHLAVPIALHEVGVRFGAVCDDLARSVTAAGTGVSPRPAAQAALRAEGWLT